LFIRFIDVHLRHRPLYLGHFTKLFRLGLA
jgi:hypothetical protein